MKAINIKLLFVFLTCALYLYPDLASAEDGYRLWLRYDLVENEKLRNEYLKQINGWYVAGSSPTISVIASELTRGISGLLGEDIKQLESISTSSLVVGIRSQLPLAERAIDSKAFEVIGDEGYIIRRSGNKGKNQLIITANTDQGLLYGTFHFLRLLQTHSNISNPEIIQTPKVDVRVLNHWDNLDRTSERGYAGFSIWDWHRLPDYLDPRYTDYARANASIGVNGTVLTNVNANALVLTPAYLEKAKALADVFRPYGIRVYLTARFSAPIEIGGLDTADPLNTEVQQWWNQKVKEIYRYIPDFGGFLVKADSEGQPGPHSYKRTHAEGANMLADALKPHEGIVMWRAFVYSHEEPEDRAKQAYNEFKPLDGKFRDNVLIQVKNGPIDFQPREPFHPLFGAMPETPLMMEFQITQEYLGQATQLVYQAPMYEEVLRTDTHAKGNDQPAGQAGSTVAEIIDGSLHNYQLTGMAGVANTGTDRNWTGHLFGQSNWYAFGRQAWDPYLTSEEIAEEWIRMTFNASPEVTNPVNNIMMQSWEAAIDYMTPLGLHHLMGTSHHYGPAPWVDDLPRADWTPAYYHRADSFGIGFDRSSTGSNAASQYAEPLSELYGNLQTVPEKYLLWFHHVSWDHPMESGRTLWEELWYRYQSGVNAVKDMQNQWEKVAGKIDQERFDHVNMLLTVQEKEARWWKDACLLYFQTFSNKPFPDFVDKPEKSLEYYKSLRFPYAPGIRPDW